jgi:outer membrane receptor protein involved in Fe transport
MIGLATSLIVAAAMLARATPQTTPPQPPPTTALTVTVVATPLPGEKVPIGLVPAPVQVVSGADVERTAALDLSAFLARRANGIYLNEIQGNPLQADLNYRGYTASPLLGTPQGLSVYMDGVRLNQPFGDVVSWDLIPRIAIATATLMPGSNPVFGLNTLGGSIALQTKTGLAARGTTVQGSYGSDARRVLEFEHGGHARSSPLHWYLAGSVFDEAGWRTDSPSDASQVFGKLGWLRDDREVTVSAAHADTSLTGNGLQEVEMLARDRAGVYTKPDTTENRSTLVSATTRHRLNARTFLEGAAYYRHLRTATLNGDINEESLDQALYQPSAAERAALAAAGYGSIPASGLEASNTPFPSLRCIANVLAGDEPAEKCNGLINRGDSRQQSGGASAQLSRRDAWRSRENVFTVGGGIDRSGVSFRQSTELGYLNPDRSVTGLGAFGDGVSGGTVDDEPFDARVDLHGTITTWSAFAADVLPLGRGVHASLSGRFNRTTIANRDRIQPGGGAGSLDGDHAYSRFNPAIGVTWDAATSVNVYAAYNEGSRAPTSIELGCADPEQPCKLPNAMAGDPPLEQVVTRSVEAGVRGRSGRVTWHAGVFRAVNRDDILFVSSPQTGFGYFRNVAETLRRGMELRAEGRVGRVTAGAGYTFLAATFASAETVNGSSNSTNGAALDGHPGVDGTIDIAPGDRLPLAPRHVFKAFADADLTSRLAVDVDLLAVSASYARGNENNAHQPDGTYYLGPGTVGGYVIVNAGARLRLTRWLDAIAQVNNLFDREYATAAQLGPAGFTADGAFVARPLPPEDGEFPLRHSTFLAPGAPLRGWAGFRVRF